MWLTSSCNGMVLGLVLLASGIAWGGDRTHPAGVEGSDQKARAKKLIEDALKKPFQRDEGTTSSDAYEATIDQVLRAYSANVTVNGILNDAKAKARTVKEPAAAKSLRDALSEAQEIFAFKPVVEAPLPDGFPEQTQVGEIRVKRYPKYRLARTMIGKSDDGAFWSLFLHIKSKDIAMTAPVEMTYGEAQKNEPRKSSMAFLYRSLRQGAVGKEGQIEVVDVPAMLTVSLGVRGDVSQARLAESKAHLDGWLKRHASDYEVSGPIRVMGYNSPFVAANRRYSEVEIPIREIQSSR